MRRPIKPLMVAAALAAAPAQAATVFDAFASFDGTQGAGNFRYTMTTPPAGVAPLSAPVGGCVIAGSICLQAGTGLPGAYKSVTASTQGSVLVPDDRLLVHPGTNNAILVSFVAPTDGAYDFAASFNVQDMNPTGVGLFGFTNAGGVSSTFYTGFVGPGVSSQSRSGSFELDAGQVILFGINPAGNYSNDSTGFTFTVTQLDATAVPEPAQWSLLIGGFAFAGAALRRRRGPTAVLA